MTPFHRALAHTLADEGYYTDSGGLTVRVDKDSRPL